MYIKELEFSLWADFIERDYLDNEFRELIDKGVINGATSNPAIFKNAILTSSAYKAQLSTLRALSPKEQYEALAIYDIKKAAKILRPLYEKKNGGYVSIEIDPFLCDDVKASIFEGKRLYKSIAEENVMIKVPATNAGYEVMEELVASCIPVNATLIFKKEQAVACAEAFARGAKRAKRSVDTVISIFVSRIDRELDVQLSEKGVEASLCGIYNTLNIYDAIEALHVSKCKALFASTGVKGDALPLHYYIEELLLKSSVNTAPVETIHAFVANGNVKKRVEVTQAQRVEHFEKVANLGIDFEAVLDAQIRDGLHSFKDSFKEILESI